MTSFREGIENVPFARTDFCGVVNTFDDRLIAFWLGFSSLAFLIASFRLNFPLFFFFFVLLSFLFNVFLKIVGFVYCYCCYFQYRDYLVLFFADAYVWYFFSIICILCLIFVLILCCSSWLNVSDIFILISLRCCHRLCSSISTAVMILIGMFLDVLFNIASHLRCNCLFPVHKAKLNFLFRHFGYFSY